MANISNQKLSPEKYIQTKVKALPYYECWASEGWTNSHELVTLIISKEMPSGHICLGIYLVDKGCLGLKNTYYRFNMPIEEYESFINDILMRENRDMEEIEVEDAHNLIFGAIDYADELGFKPNKDWAITKYFLNEDLITDGIDDIEFGKNGRPIFINGPFDNIKLVLATLNRTVGEGNYDFVFMDGRNEY
ncbi:MAG: hypothetical protein MUE85_24870 [Microscillaceae bacterium]|jgi:hypothetical protein|nr:hypothetical protein [Microscillaceae bacterium]